MVGCKICGNVEQNHVFAVKEMLQGSREKFDYLECNSCGCVQIVEAPEDMSDYYGNATYGSFGVSRRSMIKSAMRAIRNKYAIRNEGGLLGFLLNKLNPLPDDYCVIKNYAKLDAKILDIGCGIGSYILDLERIGFVNVSGIDPYIEKDFVYPNGVFIQKKYIEQVDESYDLILSHHSFEHVPDPLETLISIKRRLVLGGRCLLTIPTAEDLYRHYRENCYLIQAPQHYFLHTIKSLSFVAEKADLKIEKIVRDAGSTSAWSKCSELWGKNISSSEVSGNINQYLTRDELHQIDCMEDSLKREHKGDNVTFVLRNDG